MLFFPALNESSAIVQNKELYAASEEQTLKQSSHAGSLFTREALQGSAGEHASEN